MKVGFFGTPSYVIPILKTLNDNFDLVLTVTSPDTKQGRHQILTPSPVKKFVLENNITTKLIFSDDKDFKKQIVQTGIDLAFVAAYGSIIAEDVLDIPKYGFLNAHPSLLPKYRGPSPIQNTLLDGVINTGVTIIRLDKQIDHGPILVDFKYDVTSDDNNQTLHDKLFDLAASDLESIIKDYVGGKINLSTQNEAEATFTQKITKQDGFFRLDKKINKDHLNKMIKAFYPWPTAWTKYPIDKSGEEKIIKFLPNNLIQIEGRNPITYKELINGFPQLKTVLDNIFQVD